MKKIFSLFLAILMIVLLLPTYSITAQAYTDGIFRYEVPGGTRAIITGCDKTASGSITVPSKVWYNGDYMEVKEIYTAAFEGCSEITSVTLPEELEIIRNDAFKNCSKLTAIEIPGTVVEICSYAFDNCSSLSDVSISDGVDFINSFAFRGCSSLKSIDIPAGVSQIGNGAFKNCSSLEAINVADDNTHFCSEDGVLFNKSKTDIVAYPSGKSGEYIIPDGVQRTINNAFDGCAGLTEVTVPDSLFSFGNARGEFAGCENLTLRSRIGSYAQTYAENNKIPFIGCENGTYGVFEYSIIADKVTITKVKEASGDIVVPSTIEGYPVTSIGRSAFNNAFVNSVVLPSGITSICTYAFYSCKMQSIVLPDTLKVIGDNAFEDCRFESVKIPDTVTYIGDFAFESGYLKDITIPGSVNYIGYCAFGDNASLKKAVINKGVVSIGGRAFELCKSLVSIKIPTGVEELGGYAFSECTSLMNASIASTVKGLDKYVFAYCSALEWIDIADENKNYSSVDGVVFNKEKTELLFCPLGRIGEYVIPDGVTRIAEKAFESCEKLTMVTIPSGVTLIPGYAFAYCNSLTTVVIPEGVVNISAAFINCGALTNIVLPESLERIGSAFENCTSLTSIIIPDGVTDIYSICENCPSLTEAVIPDSVTYISNSAFSGCNDLTIYGVKGSYAEEFADENEIPFESSVTDLAVTCNPYKTVYLPGKELDTFGLVVTATFRGGKTKNVTALSAIGDCDLSSVGTKTVEVSYGGLSTSFEVTVDANIIEYPESAHPYKEDEVQTWVYTSPTPAKRLIVKFSEACELAKGKWDNDRLTVDIDDNNYFGYGFQENELKGAIFSVPGDTVRFTLNSQYASNTDCYGFAVSEIQAVDYPFDFVVKDGKVEITNVDENTVGAVDIPAEICGYPVTTLHDFLFKDCKEITSVTLPDTITEIPFAAFANCYKLTTVKMSDKVTEIGDGAFNSCISLKDFAIPSGLTCINGAAFAYCQGFKNVVIPNGITEIYDMAFAQCHSLTSITIPSSVINIDDDAFLYSENLTIYGQPGSYAETYAIAHEIPFSPLSDKFERTIVMKKEQIKAYVDGQILPMTDYGNGNYAMAKSMNGTYALPLRCIGEAFDMRVDYLGSGKTKLTNAAGDYVVVTRDSNILEKYDVNNNLTNSFTADFATFTEAGITYVPMRAVSEALGLGVSYVGSGTTGHGSYVAVSTDITLNLQTEYVLAEIEKAYLLGL